MAQTATFLAQFPALFYTGALIKTRVFQQIFGQPEKVVGKNKNHIIENPFSFIHPDDVTKVQAYFLSLDSPEYEVHFRVIVNQQTRWVTEKGTITYHQDNIQPRMSGLIIDQTDMIESEHQLESIVTSSTNELLKAKAVLEETLKQQEQREQTRINILQRSQLQQSIAFEISTCDSINRGDVQQSAHIICTKLKSGLSADHVIYQSLVNKETYQLAGTSEQEINTASSKKIIFPQDFISRLKNSLCIDISNIGEDRIEESVKSHFIDQYNTRSMLIFPIKYEQNLVGFICVLSTKLRVWSIEEIIFVSSMADQLRTTLINRDKLLAEKQLHQLAYYDTLTQLENRTAFFENVRRAIGLSKRNQQQHAYIYIDLDDFKHVNDTYGHDIGDRVLIETANIIKMSVRDTDHCARVGGDEFNILLLDIKSQNNVEEIMETMLRNFAEPKDLSSLKNHQIKVSIGISLIPKEAKALEVAIKKADQAMYQAKKSGKNQYQFSHQLSMETP